MDLLPLFFFSIPISLFMWFGNLTLSKLWSSDFEERNVIPPTRWLFSTLAPLVLMAIALRRKSVSMSGAILGVIFAFMLSIANHAFFICLITFFFSSSRATKFRADMKRKFESDFKEGEGQRNWIQVLCNGGMATQLAILYLIDCGSGERAIDFGTDYRASWLNIAVMSAFACCNGDTWASEFGSVLSPHEPWLFFTGEKVPRGTNGGISGAGLYFSLFGGLLVGLLNYITIRFTVEPIELALSPSQLPIIAFGCLAGTFGAILDSALGRWLQYSGITEDGKIVQYPGPGVKRICGYPILDNNSVNLISSIVTAIIIPMFAATHWPER